jgi:RNA polymerase sigma-70 factor (ECF subfamily)
VTDFLEVYDMYFRDVYRYALALTRNEAMAEEITQETFFKALSSLEQFDGRCKISVWLCQIAKNTYLSMCRKEKYLAGDADGIKIEADQNLEEQYANRETARSIYELAQELEEPYREVFLLRVIGEMSFKSIAELLGKKENWARVTYHRARMKIKEELK